MSSQETTPVSGGVNKQKPVWELTPEEIEQQLDMLTEDQKDALLSAAESVIGAIHGFTQRVEQIVGEPSKTLSREPFNFAHFSPDYMAIASLQTAARAQQLFSFDSLERVRVEMERRRQGRRP